MGTLKKAANEIQENINPETKKFVRNSLDLANQIDMIMQDKDITQSDIADRLSKTPSEISKWLSGSHNLTLYSISKLEVALGEEIIMTPTIAKKKFSKIHRIEHVRIPKLSDDNKVYLFPTEKQQHSKNDESQVEIDVA